MSSSKANQNINIRRASDNDIDELYGMLLKFYNEMSELPYSLIFSDKLPKQSDIAEQLKSEGHMYYLTIKGDYTIGFTHIAIINLPIAEISSIYTKPSYRYKGSTSRAVRLILDELNDLGLTDIRVEINDANEASKKLFSSFGLKMFAGFYAISNTLQEQLNE